MNDRYVVFGNPINHSKSPLIHRLFAEATGQQLSYEAQLVPVTDFLAVAKQFFAGGGMGANVTVPFKEAAWQLCDELSDDARHAGAVNTLTRLVDGRLRGDNTDGLGLVADLVRHECELEGKRLLLLGAGGAARGVVPSLLRVGVQLFVANRSTQRALDLAALFPDGAINVINGEELQTGFEIIINATSASLAGELPSLSAKAITPETLCYDMMYGATPTTFNRWAQALGARKAIDGLGMLVGQAAESFYLWRGVRPDVEPVLARLRSVLNSGINT